MKTFPVSLTPSQKAAALQAIDRLFLEGKDINLTKAFGAANEACGFPRGNYHTPCYRATDAYFQKLRKAGVIEKRQASGWVWNLTDKGRAAMSKDLERQP